MDWTGLLTLVASLALPLLVGILGGIITTPSIEKWYKTIRKPSWNPPNWLFGPVWASLYILMGVTLWLVLSSVYWNSPQAEGTDSPFCRTVVLQLSLVRDILRPTANWTGTHRDHSPMGLDTPQSSGVLCH